MNYPIIYIGQDINRDYFAGLINEEILLAKDINSARSHLMSVHSAHIVILYEQHNCDNDFKNIRLLKSLAPFSGVILVVTGTLDDEARKQYLKVGVASAIPLSIKAADFQNTLNFLSEYTFKFKQVNTLEPDMTTFRMPFYKRLFDVLVSFFAIIILSPLMGVVAILIKLDSPGPVIYKSKRVGSNYKVFDFLKFRSMRTDADSQVNDLKSKDQYADNSVSVDDAKITLTDEEMKKLLESGGQEVLFSDDFAINEEDKRVVDEVDTDKAFVKIEDDPRITKFGHFIRKYSIDELPQLFNILKGDMSLVGNRPLPLYEAERLTSDEYIERFMCPSGLTGLWQVEKRGHGGKLSPEERKFLDIQYARQMSFWLDLKIILRTFTAFIQKENV